MASAWIPVVRIYFWELSNCSQLSDSQSRLCSSKAVELAINRSFFPKIYASPFLNTHVSLEQLTTHEHLDIGHRPVHVLSNRHVAIWNIFLIFLIQSVQALRNYRTPSLPYISHFLSPFRSRTGDVGVLFCLTFHPGSHPSAWRATCSLPYHSCVYFVKDELPLASGSLGMFSSWIQLDKGKQIKQHITLELLASMLLNLL